MNQTPQHSALRETRCGANLSYILLKDIFAQTQYKAMRSHGGDCFVPCVQMLYNGRPQLYYLTGNYRSLKQALTEMRPEVVQELVEQLLRDVAVVGENGHLTCMNIPVSPERIYVDLESGKAKLLYLPVQESLYPDEQTFVWTLRRCLTDAIQSSQHLISNETRRLCRDLMDRNLVLSDIPGRRVRIGETVTSEYDFNTSGFWSRGTSLDR